MSNNPYVYQMAVVILLLNLSLACHFIRLFSYNMNKILGFLASFCFLTLLSYIILGSGQEIRITNGDTIGLFLTQVMFQNYIFNPISLSIVFVVWIASLIAMLGLNVFLYFKRK